MLKKNFITLFVLFFIVGNSLINAQFKDFGIKGGIQFNLVSPATEFEHDNGFSLSSMLFRGYLRFELSHDWNAELSAGYGKLSGDDFNYATLTKGTGEYSTSIIPIEARILYTPFELESWNPYFYAGIGALNYSVGTKPSVISVLAVEESGWTAVIPFGLGTEIKLTDEVLLDLSVGANYTLTENLNYYNIDEYSDTYFNIGAGITFTGESMYSDKDGDGLIKKEELELGTDPNNPDTDGDGLKDGAEVKQYNTDPKNADTDGDGLKDGEEVLTHKTNPTKADTDGDGLKDGEEVNNYKTNPINPDTDGDGLKDGEEVLTYKTNPLKADTDGDGLKDGEEVNKYKTNPLNADTDAGSVQDGQEVTNGTNPLDPSDDVKKQTAVVEKEMTFENVLFPINRSQLTKAAKKTLDAAYEAITKLENAKLNVSGHACDLGAEKPNMKLSEKRANSVKTYLVKKGMSADAVVTEAYGETKPAVPNTNEAKRKLNRRAELKAVYSAKE